MIGRDALAALGAAVRGGAKVVLAGRAEAAFVAVNALFFLEAAGVVAHHQEKRWDEQGEVVPPEFDGERAVAEGEVDGEEDSQEARGREDVKEAALHGRRG